MTARTSHQPRVLVSDSDYEAIQWITDCLVESAIELLVVAPSSMTAIRELDMGAVDAIILGDALVDPDTIEALSTHDSLSRVPAFVLAGDGSTSNGTAATGVYYVLQRSFRPSHVRALIGSALGLCPVSPTPTAHIRSRTEAADVQRILALSRRFARQENLSGAAAAAVSAITELIDTDRAYCLFYDAESGDLWPELPSRSNKSNDGSEDDNRDDDTGARATRGLAGFAARTAGAAVASYARDDPRYYGPIDDPHGDGDEHIAAQAVVGSDHEVHAVFVAVREGIRPTFSEKDLDLFQSLAQQSGPHLGQMALQLAADTVLQERQQDDLFRREALEAMASRGKQGDVIRVSPAWVSWAYWLIVAILVIAVTYVSIGHIDHYSTGPAIVRARGRTPVVAKLNGLVAQLLVSAGEAVSAGQLLARFHDATESSATARAQLEFDAQLRNRMLNPGDATAAQAVRSLRERFEAAQAQLDDRHVRAPRDGIIGAVRVREGQHVIAGDPLLSIVGNDAELFVVAFLPGGDRPRIAAGMPIRLQLSNYRYAYQTLVVDSIDEEVIGPREAMRYLGPELADALPISGPIVLVRARLPSSTFKADGLNYRYYDGMPAVAEVKVKSEAMLHVMLPGLKRWTN